MTITPRRKLLKGLGIVDDVARLEESLGADFAADEGARFVHRDMLEPIVTDACARLPGAQLEERLVAAGVTWSRFLTMTEAIASEPRLFAKNPIFSNVAHPSGQTYPTPGAAARIPADERGKAPAAPRMGADTDEVLADFLGLGDGEIGRLHDDKVVA